MTVHCRETRVYIALNGGPHFKFSEAVALLVKCDSQQELDPDAAKVGQMMQAMFPMKKLDAARLQEAAEAR